MKIGIVILPEQDWSVDRWRWERADSYGFDHAWTYDHLAWRSLADHSWHGTIPTLAAAALTTHAIRLGTLVTTPNFRHPVPLAKDLMTLDVMSRGRINLAVGAGAEGYDAAVLGGPTLSAADRHARFVEFCGVLDASLSQPVTNWHGQWYSVVEARMLPGTVQKPRPPMVIAANGPAGMRLAATSARMNGDGWVTLGPQDKDVDDNHYWRVVADAALRMDECLTDQVPLMPFTRLVYLGSRGSTTHSVEHFRDHVGRAAELGFTDVVLPWPRETEPFRGPETLVDGIAAVLPELWGM